MVGNGFDIDLYFTGMSRLFRAPETAANDPCFFFNSKMLTGKCVKVLLTGGQAERKLGLKVTSLTVKVIVRYHHHHSFTPAGKRCQRQILIGGVETHLEHKQVLIFNCK